MLKNKKYKIISVFLILVFIFSSSLFLRPRIEEYFMFRKVAKAITVMPYSFGGTITYYQPVCVPNDPSATNCANCFMCTGMLPPGTCNLFQEIQYIAAGDTFGWVSTVCVPKGFPFLGGMPHPKGQMLGGGASNIFPWIIGVSAL